MPEVSEVATFRDNLKPFIHNKTLTNITVQSGRYHRHPETWNNTLTLPARVESIETKGKLLIWNLENNQHIFVQHGMTGKWSLKEEKHNHLKFEFNGQNPVYFNDARNFGSVQFGDGNEKRSKLNKLGPDPLQETITFDQLSKKLSPNKTIGELMLDQSWIGGLGNYLRAEICYYAGISPFRPSNSLSSNEWDRLLEQINSLPKISYQLGGATLRDYYSIDGKKGKFSERFAVYGRKFDPENNPVLRSVDETNRAIWWVPNVQR